MGDTPNPSPRGGGKRRGAETVRRTKLSLQLRAEINAGQEKLATLMSELALDGVGGSLPAMELQSEGAHGTSSYRVRALAKSGTELSLWHDVPLFGADGCVHFVCEIPRNTRAKYEIATNEPGNPVKQDLVAKRKQRRGSVMAGADAPPPGGRTVRSYAKGDIYFNYGCLPRTWEDPTHVHSDAKCRGDNDPLDVCEIGMRPIPTGCVRRVKVLGVLCMIDEGEADWKIIAIDVEDKWAESLKDVSDVERLVPGMLASIREWWRTYKLGEGKALNQFALDEAFLGEAYATRVILECYGSWRKLLGERQWRKMLSEGGGGEGLDQDAASAAAGLWVPGDGLDGLDLAGDEAAVAALDKSLPSYAAAKQLLVVGEPLHGVVETKLVAL